jgi:hypothetical protein
VRPDRNRGATALFVCQGGPCGTCADTGRALGDRRRPEYADLGRLLVDSDCPDRADLGRTFPDRDGLVLARRERLPECHRVGLAFPGNNASVIARVPIDGRSGQRTVDGEGAVRAAPSASCGECDL